ncbi:hypothetical protein OF83DRAFT_1177048 [Amylostereum chailletii]|nr:hypothetical protein OF83DRAFT_1177048 [Amylostereum chailletii]
MVDVARYSPIPTYPPSYRTFNSRSLSKPQSPTVSPSPTGSRTSSPGVKNTRGRHDGLNKAHSSGGLYSPPQKEDIGDNSEMLVKETRVLANKQYDEVTKELGAALERYERDLKLLNDAKDKFFRTVIPFAVPADDPLANSSDTFITEEELVHLAYEFKVGNKKLKIIPFEGEPPNLKSTSGDETELRVTGHDEVKGLEE